MYDEVKITLSDPSVFTEFYGDFASPSPDPVECYYLDSEFREFVNEITNDSIDAYNAKNQFCYG